MLCSFVEEQPRKLDPQWAVSMMNLVGMSIAAVKQSYVESDCKDVICLALLEGAMTETKAPGFVYRQMSIMSSLQVDCLPACLPACL